MEQGQTLIYKKGNEVKGHLNIPDMEIYEDKKSRFLIRYKDERNIQLEAPSVDERDKWVEVLSFLIEYNKKIKESSPERPKSLNEPGKEKKNQHKQFDQEKMKNIKLEEEEKWYLDSQKQRIEVNDSISKAKGILDFLETFPDEVLEGKVLSGVLMKKRNDKISKGPKLRWMFLFLQKSLNGLDHGNQINSLDNFPSWMDLNTIYYFKFDPEEPSKDVTGYKGCFTTDQIISVKWHNLAQKQGNIFTQTLNDVKNTVGYISDKMLLNKALNCIFKLENLKYGFDLKVQEGVKDIKKYSFYSNSITEVNKWVSAIEQIISQKGAKNMPIRGMSKQSIASSEYSGYRESMSTVNNSLFNDEKIEEDIDDEEQEALKQDQDWRREVIFQDKVQKQGKSGKKNDKLLTVHRRVIFCQKYHKNNVQNQQEKRKYMDIKDITKINIPLNNKKCLELCKGEKEIWKLYFPTDQQCAKVGEIILKLNEDENADLEEINPEQKQKNEKQKQIEEQQEREKEQLEIQKNKKQSQQISDETEEKDQSIIETPQPTDRSQSQYTKFLLQKQEQQKQAELEQQEQQKSQKQTKVSELEEYNSFNQQNEPNFFQKYICCCLYQNPEKSRTTSRSNKSINSSLLRQSYNY
ncbi:hypothetical protein PPERSA_05744 [Pseudocohnilembus persalinus]|uniref:PH domain-containing protein n=1 Tax=Pseudocohnilembus persalinus TaxID=266149 RepID=A0A0V0QHZ1_PSEPJ|nr:hypothetical protein PPERSA_05744 [Pseudocohnilembus persalinus]|eukprot:KRX01905.1 hypothetical protein PPERSA_05744 [Pseudocohnilembus persalinus]